MKYFDFSSQAMRTRDGEKIFQAVNGKGKMPPLGAIEALRQLTATKPTLSSQSQQQEPPLKRHAINGRERSRQHRLVRGAELQACSGTPGAETEPQACSGTPGAAESAEFAQPDPLGQWVSAAGFVEVSAQDELAAGSVGLTAAQSPTSPSREKLSQAVHHCSTLRRSSLAFKTNEQDAQPAMMTLSTYAGCDLERWDRTRQPRHPEAEDDDETAHQYPRRVQID